MIGVCWRWDKPKMLIEHSRVVIFHMGCQGSNTSNVGCLQRTKHRVFQESRA